MIVYNYNITINICEAVMKLKHLLSFALTFILILNMSAIPSFASDGEMPYDMCNLSGNYNPDSNILDVKVSLNHAKGKRSAQFKIGFWANDLDYLGATDLNKNYDVKATLIDEEGMFVSINSDVPFTEDTVYIATFKVSPKTTEKYVNFYTNEASSVVDSVHCPSQQISIPLLKINGDPKIGFRTEYDFYTKILYVTAYSENMTGRSKLDTVIEWETDKAVLYDCDYSSAFGDCEIAEDMNSISLHTDVFVFFDDMQLVEFKLQINEGVSSVKININNESTADSTVPLTGGATVDIPQTPPTYPSPVFRYESSFDKDTDELTLTVSADKIKPFNSIFLALNFSTQDVLFIYAKEDSAADYHFSASHSEDEENSVLKLFAQANTETMPHRRNSLELAVFKLKVRTGVRSVTFSVNKNSSADYYGKYKFEPQTFTIDVHPELPVCEHKNTYTVEGVPPDCYSEGKTEEITCRDCGYVLKDSRILDPLFHNFIDGFCEYCGLDEKPLRYDSAFSRYISFSEYDEFILITLKPMSPDGTTASLFKKMFSDEVELPIDDDTAVPCGMSFIHRRRGYITTVWGDVNSDGRITAADARIILRIAAKLDPEDDFIMTACDYNQNYIIEASEARATLRYAARLSNTLYQYGQ